MKILIVWQSVFPWEVRVEKFADTFLALGHEVTLLSRKKGGTAPRETLPSGLKIIRVGADLPDRWSLPTSFNPIWRKALRTEIARERPDLIIARDIPLAEATGHQGRRLGIPVIMDMAEHYPGAMRSWKKYQENPFAKLLVHDWKIPDWVEKRALAAVDGVVTVCEEQIDRLARDYGYPRERMTVVNNSPKKAWFAGARKGPTLPKPRVFGHHGHMTPERGLNLLLDAFFEVQKTHPEIELQLAGSGESAGEVTRRVEELGIARKIKLIGRYTHADLDQLYGDIDVGVLPYPPNELINHTLSNKIFDYMACGKPVITSEASPMKRLIVETKAGVTFEPWSVDALVVALKRVLSAPAEDLRKMSESGNLAVRNRYNWEADVDALLAFVSKVK